MGLGSELAVRSSSQMAKKIRVSESFIGLVILGFGTQLPLIISSVRGAFEQLYGIETSQLVPANVVSANITQTTLILGICGLITVFKIKKLEIAKNGLILITASLLALLLAADGFISPSDGLVLLMFYLGYLIWLPTISGISDFKIDFSRLIRPQAVITFFRLLISLFVIFYASNWVIGSSAAVLENLEMNKFLVRLFLMGVGTSLPSLVISLNAAAKGSADLMIGNIIGSSIASLLAALGGSALIAGWVVERSIARFDLVYLLFSTVVIVLFLLTRRKFERKESLLIIALYAVYLSLKVLGF